MRGGIGSGPIAAGAIGAIGDTEAPPGLADRIGSAPAHRPGADRDEAALDDAARSVRVQPNGEGAAAEEDRTSRS